MSLPSPPRRCQFLATTDEVVARRSVNRVISRQADERVVSIAARNHIVELSTGQSVIARSANQSRPGREPADINRVRRITPHNDCSRRRRSGGPCPHQLAMSNRPRSSPEVIVLPASSRRIVPPLPPSSVSPAPPLSWSILPLSFSRRCLLRRTVGPDQLRPCRMSLPSPPRRMPLASAADQRKATFALPLSVTLAASNPPHQAGRRRHCR